MQINLLSNILKESDGELLFNLLSDSFISKRLSSTKQLKKANWDADDRTSAEPFYLLLQ